MALHLLNMPVDVVLDGRVRLIGERLIDKPGLLTTSSPLDSAQKVYARPEPEFSSRNHQASDLLSTIKAVKPHVLIGTSTQPGSFTEEIVREMARHVDRPIVFPLSNPTRLHEAVPKDLYAWTDGKVLCSTGSPFDPVEWKGETFEIGVYHPSRPISFAPYGPITSSVVHQQPPTIPSSSLTLPISLSNRSCLPLFLPKAQYSPPSFPLPAKSPLTLPSPIRSAECNTSTLFPGLGLGCILSRAQRLTPLLLVAATKALASQSPALKDPKKALLPDVQDVREISVKLASKVIRAAERERLVGEGLGIPQDEEELEKWIKAQMWEPRYRELRRV